MVNFYKGCSSFASAVFEYNTGKVVQIRNKTVGVINRFVQLSIIGYVVGYVIVYKKGYQKIESGLSSATTKVKGIAHTNLSIHYPIRLENKTSWVFNQGLRTWDSTDYVTPAEEYDAVFVMTNMIITPGQKQGKCPEYIPDHRKYPENVVAARCKNDSDCIPNQMRPRGHGVMTGKCVKPDRPVSDNDKMCEIQTWCPVEYTKLPMEGFNFGKRLSDKSCLFEEAINFTIFIKNSVRFPEFGVSTRNINDDHQDRHYLKTCEYNAKIDSQRLCPIFRLKTIFDEISDTAFNDAAIKGGVVAIKITWDCDLDHHISECLPRYTFFRLDDPKLKISPGYNIRMAQYDKTDNNVESRTLIKAYGIRFVIMVNAKAGKFDIVPLLRNLGAGLGLLGLATVLGDICVLYCLKKRSYYRSQKYLCTDQEHGEYQYTTMQDSQSNSSYALMFENP